MEDCIFCQVIAGKLPSTILYQDEDSMVVKDLYPQAPVHWLVIPKKHVAEFVAADSKLVGKLYAVAQQIIKKEKIVRYRVTTNGKGAAFIDHLHIHLMGGVEKTRDL